MTDQLLSIAVLVLTLGLFMWDRLRYDVVALVALLASVLVGIVPSAKAFSGFGDQVVIIVGSALVVSKAISGSGTVERLLEPLFPRLTSTGRQLAVLVTAVAALSAFMKNIGALAIFIPIALQLARRTDTSPSRLMMPLAFASLIGGVMTLIGTSPNILVSRFREEAIGVPFQMFDFMPVGLGIAAVGAIFLTIGWRLVPERRPATTAQGQFTIQDYMTEVAFEPGSPMIGRTVGDLEALARGEVTVAAVIRDKGQKYIPGEHWRLLDEDVLVLEADPQVLKKLMTAARLTLAVRAKGVAEPWEELALIEAVVTPQSPLVGLTVQEFRLRSRFGVNLLAIGRSGRQFVAQLRQTALQMGDVILLQGPRHSMPVNLNNLGCLPLAYRNLGLDRPQRRDFSIPVLVVAMTLIATGVVSVAVGFFAAALVLVVAKQLSLREAYEAIDWPIIVMLGALIPVSDAVQSTGASELIAGGLASLAGQMPGEGAVVMMLVAAMLLTPFLNNAATVLVMAPIAVSLARQLGFSPDPFLMAVAVGAACDFLTPIGHQCNTLVMGPGGYRFADYARLGLPLSLIVIVAAPFLITWVWPIR